MISYDEHMPRYGRVCFALGSCARGGFRHRLLTLVARAFVAVSSCVFLSLSHSLSVTHSHSLTHPPSDLKPVRVCRNCAQMCWKAESLLLAIRANNIDLVRRYVKGGKDCNFYSGVFPPLTIAATGTSPEMVALLIQGKADVGHQVPACWWFEDQLYKTDHVGVTALHAAVQVAGKSEGGKAGSQWQIIKTLLEGNADVNARTRKGNTPLLFACNAGLPDCAALLIQHGAAVHSHNIGASLVSGIVSPISDMGVSLTGAAVNAQNSADGDTPLHRAVREAHVDCVRLLLTHGAHTHLLNACDLTPQTLADRLRQRAVIDLLSAHASSASQTPAARTSHRTPQPCMSAAGAPPPPHWPTDSKDSGNHSSTGAGVAACTSGFTPGSRVAT